MELPEFKASIDAYFETADPQEVMAWFGALGYVFEDIKPEPIMQTQPYPVSEFAECFSAVVFHNSETREYGANPVLTTFAKTMEELDANLQKELSIYTIAQIGESLSKFSSERLREINSLEKLGNFGFSFVIHRYKNTHYYDSNVWYCFPYREVQEKLILPT
jgi:hypothetical protein